MKDLSRSALVLSLVLAAACGEGVGSNGFAPDGGAGPATGAGGNFEDTCARARARQASCPDVALDLWDPCEDYNLCRANCVLEDPCNSASIVNCVEDKCAGSGGGGESGTGAGAAAPSGGTAGASEDGGGAAGSSKGGTAGASEDGGGAAGPSGGSGGSPGGLGHPKCLVYAQKYCGCLGAAAAPNCVKNIANNCDWIWDSCASGYSSYVSCVLSTTCGEFVDACTLGSCS